MTQDPKDGEHSEAHQKIESGCRQFLQKFGYTSELGIFSGAWRIYREVSLENFETVKPKKDRMLLPGMTVTPDLLDAVIKTFATVWRSAQKGALSKNELSTLTRKEALRLGATDAVSDQLAQFVPACCIEEENHV